MPVTDVGAGYISEKNTTVNETCSSGVRQVVNIVKLLLEADICHKTHTHTHTHTKTTKILFSGPACKELGSFHYVLTTNAKRNKTTLTRFVSEY